MFNISINLAKKSSSVVYSQPTEAIKAHWWNTLSPGSFGQSISFKLEVIIRSVNNLFQHFVSLEPHRNHTKHIYTRSGEYIIKSALNESCQTAIFFYLEEGTCNWMWIKSFVLPFLKFLDGVIPQFLRNSQIYQGTITNRNRILPGVTSFYLPCVSSHAESHISAYIAGKETKYSKTSSGIQVVFNTGNENERHEMLKSVICVLAHGNISDTIDFVDLHSK